MSAISKITPGPWETGASLKVVAGKVLIADCGIHAQSPEIEAQYAVNARAIAAVPDMIAALEALVEMSRDRRSISTLSAPILKVAAALAKARGE